MNIESVVEIKPNPNIPEITSGDTVRVHARIVEGDKERIQVFQGVVIKIRNRGIASSFTVRRVSNGVGVERTFPYHSPRVEKVEFVRRGKKRRAKLYYLRNLSAKTARLAERRLTQKELGKEQERIQGIEDEKARIIAEEEAAAAAAAAEAAAEAVAEEAPAEAVVEPEPVAEAVVEAAPEASAETESEEKTE